MDFILVMITVGIGVFNAIYIISMSNELKYARTEIKRARKAINQVQDDYQRCLNT